MNRAERRRQRKNAAKATKNAKPEKSASAPPGHQTLTIQESLDLASQHHNAGRLPEAESIYQKVLQADPNQPVALHLLGVIALQVGKNDIAVDLIMKALAIKPEYVDAHNNLGVALKNLGKLDEAIASYHKALTIKPDNAETHNNLGVALQGLGKLDEAVASHHKALAINPDDAEAHNNLGVTLHDLGKLYEAITNCRKALAIKPDYAEAHYNLGKSLKNLGKLDEAIASYYKAIAIKPDYAEAHNNLAICLLRAGNLTPGWEEFEWRWDGATPPKERRDFSHLPWNGESLVGKSIAISCEQGIGDEIMYASLLPDLAAWDADVLVECNERLVPLLQRSFRNATFIAKTDPPDKRLINADIDFQSPIGSLCRHLRGNLDAFDGRNGFLVADAERTGRLRCRYEQWSRERPVIGISWYSGNLEEGGNRSIELPSWEPILSGLSCLFVTLQYGDVNADLKRLKDETGVDVRRDEEIDSLVDLDGFAAQVAAMDLIVSIDNTTVHMAGALGKPVWTLLPFDSDWRWLTGREDSPWYPTMRLFRQRRLGDWSNVIERVAKEIKGFLLTLGK